MDHEELKSSILTLTLISIFNISIMKSIFKFSFLLILLLVFTADANAQRRKKKKQTEPAIVSTVVPPYSIALGRQMIHDNINKEQKMLFASDGIADTLFQVSGDMKINNDVSFALQNKVDWLQYEIETDPNLDQRLKSNYLNGIVEILKYVRSFWRSKLTDASLLPQIIATYKEAIAMDKQKKSLVPLLQPLPYDAANAVIQPRVFQENASYGAVQDIVLLKLCQKYPEKTFAALKTHPTAPFTDSLIKAMGHKYPQQLYDYAQANNELSRNMQKIKDDPFIAAIVSMARNPNKSGQFYFPFLDKMVSGQLTMKNIDSVKNDPVKYFRLLVKTQIEYAARAANGDTAIGYKSLTKKLEQKAKDDFVAPINGLHESPDAIRFRSIQPLSAEELYYVAVLTDGLIYTSSYTNGVYPLMMKKIENKGDVLLKNTNFNYYRKFISQAAAYNKLKNFLGSFSNHQDAVDLMTTFVSNLEKSEGLEDGVDVADSYASIYETMPELAAQMLENIKQNYERCKKKGNQRGVAIYNILYQLFLSADSSNHIDLTKELGVPPVYTVPFSSLKNSEGRVVAQVYFYGDKDGMGVFNGFLNTYGNDWKIDRSNKQWVVINSVKGAPVSIYANRPLPEETGEDDEAQRALGAYLQENNLQPSITIHRGHSYYAPSTIAYMSPTSKIVFMGSCGGFNLIDLILQKCDDAHIIASKQIGRTAINKPFFSLLSEKLRIGKDIEWIPFWADFKHSTNAPGFEDYIPPYKNLGAIFIKAYKKEMGENDSQ
jgi:hypothetical protein